MRRNLLCCAMTLIMGAGCRNELAAPGSTSGFVGKPELGAHTLLTHDQGKGIAPARTDAITTDTTGSTLLALSMGRSPNFGPPVDSYHNDWKPIGRRNMYAFGPFYTAIWATVAAKGGAGHTLSADKPNDPVDEISLALIEIRNAARIADAVYAYPQKGMRMTAGKVKTKGPGTLIAIWGGDSSELKHTAVPSDGFRVIDSYLNLGPSSGVQVAVAVKQVDRAGTYTVSWDATPEQGAACYLIAVE